MKMHREAPNFNASNRARVLAVLIPCVSAGLTGIDCSTSATGRTHLSEVFRSEPRASLQLTSITPASGEVVTKATVVHAEIQYAIPNFSGQEGDYFALLMFDDPVGAGSFSSGGCTKSSQDLIMASGTIVLECRLGDAWDRIGGSDHIGVRFFINKVVHGSQSIVIGESDRINYEVRQDEN